MGSGPGALYTGLVVRPRGPILLGQFSAAMAPRRPLLRRRVVRGPNNQPDHTHATGYARRDGAAFAVREFLFAFSQDRAIAQPGDAACEALAARRRTDPTRIRGSNV